MGVSRVHASRYAPRLLSGHGLWVASRRFILWEKAWLEGSLKCRVRTGNSVSTLYSEGWKETHIKAHRCAYKLWEIDRHTERTGFIPRADYQNDGGLLKATPEARRQGNNTFKILGGGGIISNLEIYIQPNFKSVSIKPSSDIQIHLSSSPPVSAVLLSEVPVILSQLWSKNIK